MVESRATAAMFFEELPAVLEPASCHKVSFAHDWLITVPRLPEDRTLMTTCFATNYRTGSCDWNAHLKLRPGPTMGFLHRMRREPPGSHAFIVVETARNAKAMAARCTVQYTVFADNELSTVLYASPTVLALPTQTFMNEGVRFQSPRGSFIDHLVNAFKHSQGRKVCVRIEIEVATDFFLRGFEEAALFASRKLQRFPEAVEDDFRFDFLKHGDIVIRCVNADLPAKRQALFLSSLYFRNLLTFSQSNVHSIRMAADVVKPLLWYMHSLCFQMPQGVSIDFAQRMLEAIELFNPVGKNELTAMVQRALCESLLERMHDFDFVLDMGVIAARNRFVELKHMTCSLIANEYYSRFKAVFPNTDRDAVLQFQDGRYRDFFIPQNFIGQTPLDCVERIHRNGFRTQTVLY